MPETTTQPTETEVKVDTAPIVKAIGDQPITMYRLANILSDALGRRVREQMMYNYRANKLIKVNSSGRVEPAVALAFVVKQVTKQNAKK